MLLVVDSAHIIQNLLRVGATSTLTMEYTPGPLERALSDYRMKQPNYKVTMTLRIRTAVNDNRVSLPLNLHQSTLPPPTPARHSLSLKPRKKNHQGDNYDKEYGHQRFVVYPAAA
jgi:hypothetical protein